jgi:hypothetical protein
MRWRMAEQKKTPTVLAIHEALRLQFWGSFTAGQGTTAFVLCVTQPQEKLVLWYLGNLPGRRKLADQRTEGDAAPC